MFTLLNIDKPAGVSSRHVVDCVQRVAGTRKVGHAGTLDPLATGVLVVCLGPATRLVEYVQRMPKRYQGTFLLGQTSTTEDVEGEVTVLEDPPVPREETLHTAAEQLVGVIRQRPPAFSAVKVKGRRAYQLAREGKQVELSEREVTVHELRIVSMDYPTLTLDVACSAGTYIRTLGRDLARAVGTDAVMSALRRTAIGDFRVDDACPLNDLNQENLHTLLLPPARAVSDLPHLTLNEQEVGDIIHGRRIKRADLADKRDSEYAAFDAAGQLFAIVKLHEAGVLFPFRVFRAA